MEGTETGLRGKPSKIWPQSSMLALKAMTKLRYLGIKLFFVTKKVGYPFLLQKFYLRQARLTFLKNHHQRLKEKLYYPGAGCALIC